MRRDLAVGARTFRAHIEECASLTDRPDRRRRRDSLVLTGQVAGAIPDLIRIAEFVPAMAADAAAVLRSALSCSSADPTAR